ncbi:MAG: hypothetical protein QNJ70_09270 [Xenococcaceae cyanobacterium MO_207.B15]|nr:hypothetical protein [Xenococcaceae cyanobacterium MO_207.B15]
MKTRPHRRQFIIGNKSFFPYDNWVYRQLGSSLGISYCPDLRIDWTQDLEGIDWLLLGLAIETIGGKRSPLSEISRTATREVSELCYSWAGRWVLIGNGKLYLDASGLLGCFYGKDAEGQIWVSSSAGLLARVLFQNQAPIIDSRKLSYEIGISWYTPPSSRFEGISRLLPSQVLDLKSGEIQPKSLMPEICFERDYEEIIRQIQQILLTTLRGLAKITPDLWLGLTAGYDSRLMLALTHMAGIPVQTFTRVTARMSVADRILPPKLAQECNINHLFIDTQKRYPERRKLIGEHTGYHVSDGDAEPFIQGSRDDLKGISFGGHGFAVASGFGKLYTLPESITSIEESARQIAKIFQERADCSATSGIENWLGWIMEYPQNNLNWRDRFFIEQRQAGWLSSKEQLYDLNDLTRFPILNSAYLSSLLLSVRKDKRLGSKIQEDLIKITNPQLTKYPFNPDDSDFDFLEIVIAKARYLPQYVFLKLSKKILRSWKGLTIKY